MGWFFDGCVWVLGEEVLVADERVGECGTQFLVVIHRFDEVGFCLCSAVGEGGGKGERGLCKERNIVLNHRGIEGG